MNTVRKKLKKNKQATKNGIQNNEPIEKKRHDSRYCSASCINKANALGGIADQYNVQEKQIINAIRRMQSEENEDV